VLETRLDFEMEEICLSTTENDGDSGYSGRGGCCYTIYESERAAEFIDHDDYYNRLIGCFHWKLNIHAGIEIK
jgi:hypothetical protein